MSPADTHSAEVVQLRPKPRATPQAPGVSEVLTALRASGQTGDPKPPKDATRTPSGRLTPLGARWRRKLHPQSRPGLWRWAGTRMQEAEAAIEQALEAGDNSRADAALDLWEEAAEAAIYCPTNHRDDIRDRLRLLAHFCGVGDPTGAYLSIDWQDRSPLHKLFAVLDWHIYRALSRMDEGGDRKRLGATLAQRCANDNGEGAASQA